MSTHNVCEVEKCRENKANQQWGTGPWNDEPDRKDFKAYGFECFVHRNLHGNWCGYVGVPRRHPAFGHGYDDIRVNVHGGLTYSAKCGYHLCHPGSRKVWWLGFDCAHSGDYIPQINQHLMNLGVRAPGVREVRPYVGRPHTPFEAVFAMHKDGVRYERYWTLADVVEETRKLARQLATLSGKHVRYTDHSTRRQTKTAIARRKARLFSSLTRWNAKEKKARG